MARNWLEAHADFSAGVHTFGQCMALADLTADGDHRLIIADHGLILANRSQAKLKVIYNITFKKNTTINYARFTEERLW